MDRIRGRLLVLTAASILIGGCASSAATAGANSTTGATAAPTAAATATIESAATTTPVVTAPPTATPTPAATPAPTPTATPTLPTLPPAVAASTPPAATPTSPAQACTGSASTKDFFAQAAKQVSWDVYCAVLPSGWHVDSGSFDGANGGSIDVTYQDTAGDAFMMQEGNFCHAPTDCSPHITTHQNATFAGISTPLYIVEGGPHLAIYIRPGQANAYTISEMFMGSADTFVAYLAAAVKVPKS